MQLSKVAPTKKTEMEASKIEYAIYNLNKIINSKGTFQDGYLLNCQDQLNYYKDLLRQNKIKEYKVLRQKVALLKAFKSCKTESEFISMNNDFILPLYNQVKEVIKNRIEKEDFGEVYEAGFYFSDFNYLHDSQDFLESLSFDIQSELSHLHFIKYGWTSIKVA